MVDSQIVSFFKRHTKIESKNVKPEEVIELAIKTYPQFFDIVYEKKFNFNSLPVFIIFFLLAHYYDYNSDSVRKACTSDGERIYKLSDMGLSFHLEDITDALTTFSCEGVFTLAFYSDVRGGVTTEHINDREIMMVGFPGEREDRFVKKLLNMKEFPKIPSFYIPSPKGYELRFLCTYLYCRYMNYPYNGGFIHYLSAIVVQLSELLTTDSHSYNTFKNFMRKASEYIDETLDIPSPSFDLKSITLTFMRVYDAFSNSGINRLVVDINEILDASEFFNTYHKDLSEELSVAIVRGKTGEVAEVIDKKFYSIYSDYRKQKMNLGKTEDEI